MTPPRPARPALHVESIPDELRALDKWVVWSYELVTDKKGTQKWTKVPKRSDGRNADSTKPATWSTFAEVVAAADRFDGIGFVLSDDDDLVGIDLDHCVGAMFFEDWASEIVEQLDSYTEVSPSGEGLRILARGKLPPKGRKRGPVEMYETARFVTITGNVVDDRNRVEHRQAELDQVHADHIAPPKKDPPSSPPSTTPTLSDLEVIDLARNARNAGKFRALYNGSDAEHHEDTSAADLALVSLLAFYTQDADQLDRLFQGSPRMRDKWNERRSSDGRTYGQLTIDRALDNVRETYTPRDRTGFDGMVADRSDGASGTPSTEDDDQADVDPIAEIRSRWITLATVVPDPVPLIDGVIDLDTAGVLYARWGCYKTFLGIDWALHVALGWDWCGHEVSEPRPVVVLGYEAPNSIHRRAQAWCRYHDVPFPDTFLIDRRPPRLDNVEMLQLYRQALDDIDAALVIADTVTRASSGRDMNTHEADAISDGLALLKGERRAALGVGHAGKDARRGMKGSSVLEDNADFAFRLDRNRDNKGSPTGPATLTNPKQKDRESVPAMRFDLSDGLTRIGTLPGDRVILPITGDQRDGATLPVDRAVDLVREFLGTDQGWHTLAEVKEKCRRSSSSKRSVAITRDHVAEAVDRLYELEQIEQDDERRIRGTAALVADLEDGGE